MTPDLTAQKTTARTAAFARRKQAHTMGQGTAAHLSSLLAGYRGVPLCPHTPSQYHGLLCQFYHCRGAFIIPS